MHTMTREEALKLVQEDGFELDNLPEEFKKDREIVLAAVQGWEDALDYADESRQNDPDILAIIQ